MHRPRHLRMPAALGATLLVASLSLSACGGDDTDTDGTAASSSTAPSETASESASASADASESATPEKPAGTTIDITITADSVKPNGDRVKAKLGEPITLNIKAAQAGELHVHSTPEQELEFPAGTSTKKLKITQPGVIDVEDHDLGRVIVQLQVS